MKTWYTLIQQLRRCIRTQRLEQTHALGFLPTTGLKLLILTLAWGCLPDSIPLARADEFDPFATPVAEPLVVLPQRGWHFLPEGLIYHPYLAGPKESRTSVELLKNDDFGWIYDSSIGGQWGFLRVGSDDPYSPTGVQFDLEASAQMRQTNLASLDLLTSDIRVGFPVSFGRNNHQTKLGVYFLRSHPTDRLIDRIPALRNEDFFQRQSLVLGHSRYFAERFRLYGEAGYAFKSTISKKWELQFGAEYAPVMPTSCFGAPFIAANAYLREEVDFGGTLTLQAGWAWRKKNGRLFRIGAQYANGMSNQFALHDRFEQQLGIGIWHDF
ncbi:DUF1207 domain-containing protein [Rosistilla oblonga]|uniref:DUF1207 domain-containing protein n=1 Tax=Rosistilla oblonga TaxID=2527990 RepID=UPI003A9875A6